MASRDEVALSVFPLAWRTPSSVPCLGEPQMDENSHTRKHPKRTDATGKRPEFGDEREKEGQQSPCAEESIPAPWVGLEFGLLAPNP